MSDTRSEIEIRSSLTHVMISLTSTVNFTGSFCQHFESAKDDIPIFVKGCHEYPTLEGKYEYLKDLYSNEFFYKHEKRKLYLYRSRNGSWFFSENLWSTK